MSSILTNNSAMVALQTMKQINKNMGKVQGEISTGMKVATAKDNSSSWAIASTMRSDVANNGKIKDSLTTASAVVGVARAASEQIVSLLTEVQELKVQSLEPGADKGKLLTDINARLATVASIATGAQMNGINLVNAAGGGAADISVLVGVTRDNAGALTNQTFTVASSNLGALGAALADVAALDAKTTNGFDSDIDTAIAAAAAFGAAQARIDAQSEFVTKQADALKAGVGAYVDADMEEASARLQALQVQQQLATQSLSIANQAPQNILALFR